eukprot:4074012-Karenia_brevis.AAC.1
MLSFWDHGMPTCHQCWACVKHMHFIISCPLAMWTFVHWVLCPNLSPGHSALVSTAMRAPAWLIFPCLIY